MIKGILPKICPRFCGKHLSAPTEAQQPLLVSPCCDMTWRHLEVILLLFLITASLINRTCLRWLLLVGFFIIKHTGSIHIKTIPFLPVRGVKRTLVSVHVSPSACSRGPFLKFSLPWHPPQWPATSAPNLVLLLTPPRFPVRAGRGLWNWEGPWASSGHRLSPLRPRSMSLAARFKSRASRLTRRPI